MNNTKNSGNSNNNKQSNNTGRDIFSQRETNKTKPLTKPSGSEKTSK